MPWCNMPWTLLDDVCFKLLTERLKAIVIFPDWPGRLFCRLLQAIAVKAVYFDAGTLLFEVFGKQAGPTRWGVHAMLVDGAEADAVLQKQLTRSKKRRLRRRKLEEQRGGCVALSTSA